MGNNGFFAGFRATETIKRSQIFSALLIISICPLVTGSNVPGYMAIRFFGMKLYDKLKNELIARSTRVNPNSRSVH